MGCVYTQTILTNVKVKQNNKYIPVEYTNIELKENSFATDTKMYFSIIQQIFILYILILFIAIIFIVMPNAAARAWIQCGSIQFLIWITDVAGKKPKTSNMFNRSLYTVF